MRIEQNHTGWWIIRDHDDSPHPINAFGPYGSAEIAEKAAEELERMRAVPDLSKATLADTSILPDSVIVEHTIAVDAMAKGRRSCECDFYTSPDGPEPNPVERDGAFYCADCGGWMLDAD